MPGGRVACVERSISPHRWLNRHEIEFHVVLLLVCLVGAAVSSVQKKIKSMIAAVADDGTTGAGSVERRLFCAKHDGGGSRGEALRPRRNALGQFQVPLFAKLSFLWTKKCDTAGMDRTGLSSSFC
jgi:hypothetical protein